MFREVIVIRVLKDSLIEIWLNVNTCCNAVNCRYVLQQRLAQEIGAV